MDQLNERKRHILRAVIFEYVHTAEPIASELIARKYELGVRSATVRNELAEITELGFLEQPHTSAGRIPSDVGYRYFVDHLLPQESPDAAEQTTLRTATRDEETLRDLVTESTKALSRMTRLMSAAVTVKDSTVRVRHLVLTALGPDRALIVCVLENGHAENRIIECPPGATLAHIGQLNEILAATAGEKSLSELQDYRLPVSGDPILNTLSERASTCVRGLMKDLTRGNLVLEGEEFVMAQPEFHRLPDTMEMLVESVTDEDGLREAISAPRSDGDTITIGRENQEEKHWPLAILRRQFYVGDQEAGVIAIIGPTRMNYGRSISLLDYTADAISDVLTRLFARS
ncbi:MAG: heat-inducible transcriptional repressor HrcA [Armatimonadetes bacterium]|nr:heat-inducible transcriptional repressor HrcA [Armatimonadota bacterium]